MSAYLVLDGPDGCGKSTQARLLAEHVGKLGREVVHLREPGSTPVGEQLRRLLLDPATGELQPITEALLFSAARAELVAQVVAPARARGAVVIAERCYVSTLVYQCLAAEPARARGLDYDLVVELTRAAHGSTQPDRVFVLDVPVAVAAQRRARRTGDRIEGRGEPFQQRVRDAFLQVAAREPNCVVVDASRELHAVQQELRRLAEGCL